MSVINYDQWMEETKTIASTYYNTHGENLPGYTDVGHILYRRAFEQNRWPTLDHAMAEWTGWVPTPGPTPGPSPEPIPQHPGISASFYTSLADPRLVAREFAKRLADLGCTGTRVWLISAWSLDGGGPGEVAGYIPWQKVPSGGINNPQFDLWSLNPAYFDRLYWYVSFMNMAGIWPTLTGWELYSWSNRKKGMLWVPDARLGPFQNNIQGIDYSGDEAFEVIGTGGQHGFLENFYAEVVSTLEGLNYKVEIGNEMPEKGLHERLRNAWRRVGFAGHIQVNRQDDTPGQYDNMQIGSNYDLIAFHGKRDLGYLGERYEDEPAYKTFEDFYLKGSYDPSRITLSSDGCRKTTTVSDAYDYPRLLEVARDGLSRGFGYEHQLALKLRTFTEGRLDLNDLKYDEAFMRGLQG